MVTGCIFRLRNRSILLIGLLSFMLVAACQKEKERINHLVDGLCTCAGSQVCNAGGDCVDPTACADSCESEGWECGQLCGVDCGGCGISACLDGQCVCKPSCQGGCGPDGCGGHCDCPEGAFCNANQECKSDGECNETCQGQGWTCGTLCGHDCAQLPGGSTCAGSEYCHLGTCRESISCADCSLRLQVVDVTFSDGSISNVVLGVEYHPAEQEVRPRLVDIRIVSNVTANLLSVAEGPALDDAKKDLYRDPGTQNPWQIRPDGSFQLLVMSMVNTNTLAEGRIATLTFEVNSSDPVSFALLRRDQIFAPPEADQVLQSTQYQQAVVVQP